MSCRGSHPEAPKHLQYNQNKWRFHYETTHLNNHPILISSCDSPVSDNPPQQLAGQPGKVKLAPMNVSYSQQPVRPDTARKVIWQQYKAANGNGWRIRWNKHTGLPASIFMGLTNKKYAGNAEQAAHTFLVEHKALFGVGNIKQLKYLKTQTYRGVRHVTFQQTVKGVPVYEAEYKVHLRGNGQVDMANGSFYPNIDVSTSPTISKSAAVTAARSELALPASSNLKTTSKLVIYRQQDQFHLAWKLTLFSGQPSADWFYMVDAESGNILYKLNQLTDVTGDGDVYPTYPGLSSVTNKPLYGLIGNGDLDGTYANIYNAGTSRAYSSSNSFQYAPANTHFDEVSLYYHIDNFRRNFIEAFDTQNQLFEGINATAHDNSTCPNNACFSPSGQDLHFSDTSEFAKEDKVIQHEYTHAVIDDINSGISSSYSEEGAINEGTPDYFAGSFTDRSKILNYSVPSSERDMDNPDINSYSGLSTNPNTGEVNEEPHNGGEFFSSILWDLRNGSVGESATDFLVYDALYRVTGDPDFLEFRDAMMSADYEAYNGNDVDNIQNTFANKGIGEYVAPGVSIQGTTGVFQGNTYTYSAYVSGGFPPYQYRWYYRDTQNSAWIGPVSYDDTYDYTAQSAPYDYLRLTVIDQHSSVTVQKRLTVAGISN